MNGLVPYLIRHNWRSLVFATLLGAGSAACSAGLVAFTNVLLSEPDARILPQLVLIGVGNAVFSWASHAVLVKRGSRIASELRWNLLKQIIASPLRQLETIGSAPLFSVLNNDVSAIVRLFSSIGGLAPSVLTAIALLIYMGMLSWKLLLATLATLFCLWLIDNRYRALTVGYYTRSREALDPMVEGLRTVVAGVKELKLNSARADAFLEQELRPALGRVSEAEATTASVERLSGPIHQFVLLGWLALVLTFGRSFGISYASLAAYALALFSLSNHINLAVNSAVDVVKGEVALARAHAVGASLISTGIMGVPAGPAVHPSTAGQRAWKELTLIDVTHSYRNERDATFVLGPINLSVKRGEIVFILGGNGSGKSTLAKLITGLYVPESGEIWFGGEPITASNLEWYRNHFSAIFTDFTVFDTLAGLTMDEDAEERAERYLRLLQLDHKVQIEGGRFSTTQLSTGQRKRLALLASYLEDRPIYVFDEWAADQDPAFKAIFYRQLLPELKSRGKSVIVISHDERYFEGADHIVKLENGALANDSTAAFLQRLSTAGSE
jgi:putative ATP-binding cassette transporter